MGPQQALQILDTLIARVPATRQEHVLAQQALTHLQQATQPPPPPSEEAETKEVAPCDD